MRVLLVVFALLAITATASPGPAAARIAELAARSSSHPTTSYDAILRDAQSLVENPSTLQSVHELIQSSTPTVQKIPAIHQQRHQQIRTTITTQQQTETTYNSKTLYSGLARRVTWWYAANNRAEISAAVAAVKSHTASFWGVMLYCGYTIGADGNLSLDTTAAWYCDGADGAIAQFRAADIDVEIVVSDTTNFATAFAHPEPIIDSLVDLSKKYKLYGINLDIEPALTSTIPASTYAVFCRQLRKRLNAYNTRLTIDVGDFHNMLSDYVTLAPSVDRLIDMSTYRANDFKSWLTTYNKIVNPSVKRSKVGIGFAVFNYAISALNPAWISDKDGAKARIKQVITDGVPEINFFRLSPANQMPLNFWYRRAAVFSTKFVPGQTPERLTPTARNPLGAPRMNNNVNVKKNDAPVAPKPANCSSSTGAAAPAGAAATSTGAAPLKLQNLRRRIRVRSCKDCHVNPVPYDWDEAKRTRELTEIKKVTPIYDENPNNLSPNERVALYNKYREFHIGPQAFYDPKKLRGEAKKLTASYQVNHDTMNQLLENNPEIDRLVRPDNYD